LGVCHESRVLTTDNTTQRSHKIFDWASRLEPLKTSDETAGYDEYVRWCGRTGAERPPPTRFEGFTDASTRSFDYSEYAFA
jgi:hypothetical protein